MKKYRFSSFKWFVVVLLVFVLMLAVGIILLVSGMPFEGFPAVLVCMGAALGVLTAFFFFVAACRTLTIDDEKIVLPRGTRINGKAPFKRRALPFDEISSFSSRFVEGDHGRALLISYVLTGIALADSIFYSIKTKDGTTIEFTLYDFGKESEKEISETIRRRVKGE